MMKAANIDASNYTSKVSAGDRTEMDPDAGTITVRLTDLNSSVRGMIHELSNLSRNGDGLKAQAKAGNGTMTPKQYANRVLEIEKTGIINQIKVAAELGYDIEEYHGLIEQYSTGKMNDIELDIEVSSAMGSVKAAEFPDMNIREFYKQQAETLRKKFLAKEQEKKEQAEKKTPNPNSDTKPKNDKDDKDDKK